MNYLKLALIGLGLLILGLGVGYYFSPEKIVTKDKIVEKEVIKVVHEKFDPITGKVIERTVTDETKNTTETKTKVETLKTKKYYALKGGVAVDPKDGFKIIPRIGAEIRLPFFNSSLGVEGDINVSHPLIGGYLRVEF